MSSRRKVMNTTFLKEALLAMGGKPNADMAKKLDPDGFHVVTFHMIHEAGSDVVIRANLLAKVKESMEPVRLEGIDIPIDLFNALPTFNSETKEIGWA